MIRRQIVLLRRAKQILRTEGVMSLLKRALEFFGVFQYGTWYLYETAPSRLLKGKAEAEVMPKIQDFTFRIVSTNQQADELVADGLEFRSQVTKSREKLEKGAVALCIFVEQELAHISWLAMTEEAKKIVDPLPYKVDFANSEACIGGAWTNPKYRRMGLMEYGVYKRRQFQLERGLGIARGSIATRNVPSAGVAAKVGSNMYAEAHYLRILWWKRWKEKPLAQDNGFG